MMLRKSVIRQMKEKKLQYMGVIVLLAISILLYVALSMAITTMETRNEEFKEAYNQEDFHFIVSEQVEGSQLSTWEEEFDVTLEKRMYTDLDFANDTTLRLLEVSNHVNKPYISKGEMPKKEKEIAVSPVFANTHDVEVGDTISLGKQEVTVTGFMYLPDYIYILERESDLINDPKLFGIAIGSEETINNLGSNVITQISADKASKEEIEEFKDNLTSTHTLLKWLEANDNPRIEFVESEIEGSKAVTTTLPLFILALSIMMAVMILKRRMEMQRKELGTLMALGYRRQELLKLYMTFPVVIGLVGTIVGIIAGAAFSIPLTNLYTTYYNLPSLSFFDWDITVLIIGFIIPNILLLAITYFVIRKPLKQSPLTLLSPKDMSTGKKSMLEKLPIFQKGSFLTRFRLRLMIRSKTRAVYIWIGVMFSTILLMFGFVTSTAMSDLVDSTYKQILTYDYAVHYTTLQESNTEEAASPFTTNEVSVTKIGDQEEDVDSSITLYGMEPETNLIQLTNEADETVNMVTKEGFVISQPLATILNVEAGDTITVENSVNNQKLEKEIVSIAKLYIGNSIYYQKEQVNSFFGYPEEAYTAKWTNKDPADEQDVLFIENKQDIIESFESTSSLTRYAILGISVFAFFIGVVVLTLITNLIVEENSPSISLFKVMGYMDKEISKLIVNVYTPIVVLAYIVSVPIGIVSIDQMMASLVEQTGFSFPVQLSWYMVVVGFAIIMLTYYVSLAFSRRKLKQVSLQEALKKQQD